MRGPWSDLIGRGRTGEKRRGEKRGEERREEGGMGCEDRGWRCRCWLPGGGRSGRQVGKEAGRQGGIALLTRVPRSFALLLTLACVAWYGVEWHCKGKAKQSKAYRKVKHHDTCETRGDKDLKGDERRKGQARQWLASPVEREHSLFSPYNRPNPPPSHLLLPLSGAQEILMQNPVCPTDNKPDRPTAARPENFTPVIRLDVLTDGNTFAERSEERR